MSERARPRPEQQKVMYKLLVSPLDRRHQYVDMGQVDKDVDNLDKNLGHYLAKNLEQLVVLPKEDCGLHLILPMARSYLLISMNLRVR